MIRFSWVDRFGACPGPARPPHAVAEHREKRRDDEGADDEGVDEHADADDEANLPERDERKEAERCEDPLGPCFASSLEELTANNVALLDKTARAVLRVLLGQDRDGHKLDVAGKVREDGAVAWRTYVEQKTASARRLHHFRLPGGGVELSRVVVHDDYQP